MNSFKAKLLRGVATRDVSFNRRMPACIPGALSRGVGLDTIEPQIITPFGSTGAPPEYGLAGYIDANTGQFRTTQPGDTYSYGVLVRSYPTNSGTPGGNDPLGTSVPPRSGVIDVLVRGYIGGLLRGATAAKKDGTVYVWTAVSGGGHVQGGFEAAATGGSTIAMPNTWYFTGPADANGNVEIAVNI